MTSPNSKSNNGNTMAEHHRQRQGQGYGNRGERSRRLPQGPRPAPAKPLYEKRVVCGEKTFTVRTLNNHRGKAVEIREFAHGRDNIIVLPVEGLDEILSAVDEAEEALAQA